jgi:D-tyrosyl-tRNA(Tyr) deacylase
MAKAIIPVAQFIVVFEIDPRQIRQMDRKAQQLFLRCSTAASSKSNTYMRAVIQRVSKARVSIEGREHSQMVREFSFARRRERRHDKDAEMLAQRIVELESLKTNAGKMNRSIRETGGQILLFRNSTLLGDCRRGRRPSFDPAARPTSHARSNERFVSEIQTLGVRLQRSPFRR